MLIRIIKKNNCVNCTIAYEMRKRGYDVVAAESIKSLMRKPFSGWTSPDVKTIDVGKDAYEEIVNVMKNWGDDDRAQIAVLWNGKEMEMTTGHSFIAEKRNGDIVFIDAQQGKEYNKDIFKKASNHVVLYCKINGLAINDLGATACVKE